jgi:predicted membrane channel-forming protein YqfA (hemolysin III family)
MTFVSSPPFCFLDQFNGVLLFVVALLAFPRLLYLAMGWPALIVTRLLFLTLSARGLVLLFAGGACYTDPGPVLRAG